MSIGNGGVYTSSVNLAFYNTSPFLLRNLKGRGTQQKLKNDFEAYHDGFSPNVHDILTNFEFRNQIPRLSKDALGLRQGAI
jgi:type I restriction enzyme M protein